MQFSGEERFSTRLPELWQKLTDASFLARHLPGVQKVELAEPKKAVCRVRPGFSFLSAPMKMTVEIFDEREEPSHSARMRVRGEAIAASLSIETTVELEETSDGTNLVWRGDVTQMSGLLKTISRGLLEGAARKVIADGWANIRGELDAA